MGQAMATEDAIRRPSVKTVSVALQEFGWAEPSLVRTPSGSGRALLAHIGGRPAISIALAAPRRAISIGYSSEADYTLSWTGPRLELHSTTLWKNEPGDSPIVSVPTGSRTGVRNLLALTAPDGLAHLAVSLPPGARRHRGLPQRMADLAVELRSSLVVEHGFDEDLDVADDLALLSLLRQLLFVRWHEDSHARSSVEPRIENLVDVELPGVGVEAMLANYADTLNTGLFASGHMDARDLPQTHLGSLLEALVEPWPGLTSDLRIARPDLAGRWYQSYLAQLPNISMNRHAALPAVAALDRRDKRGAYYTPLAVADEVVEATLTRWLAQNRPSRVEDVRILDPACGSGAFLVAAFRKLRTYFSERQGRSLSATQRRHLLTGSIFGVDIDPSAVMIAQLQLLEEADLSKDVTPLPDLSRNVVAGDQLLRPPTADPAERDVDFVALGTMEPIDWNALLEQVEGGFSLVLMNPPFGAQRSHARAETREYRANLRRLYPRTNEWGADLASRFVDLADQLLNEDGAIGVVLPRTAISGASGTAIREILEARGVYTIVDFRGVRLFPTVSAQVAIVSAGSGVADKIRVREVVDSRVDVDALLDETMRSRLKLVRVADVGAKLRPTHPWTAFALRWQELRQFVACKTVAIEDSEQLKVVQGTQTGANSRFTFAADSMRTRGRWVDIRDVGRVEARYLPILVDGPEIRAFNLMDAGYRLLLPLPMSRGGSRNLQAVIDRLGRPTNVQPGDLEVLLRPKVLIRAFSREPVAAVDEVGNHILVKGTGGGLAVGVSPDIPLRGVAALFNSSLYQWLMRGYGAPRADETVELSVGTINRLPWPNLDASMWAELERAAERVESLLDGVSSIGRTGNSPRSVALNKAAAGAAGKRHLAVREARRAIDGLVFDLLAVSSELRAVVFNELLREG